MRQSFLAIRFVATSWMAAEQIVLKRQQKAKEEGETGAEFIHCHFFVRNLYTGDHLYDIVAGKKHPNFLSGMIWPLSLVSLVFRVFSLSLIVTLLRYCAIPLYAVIFLLAITLGRFWNKDKRTFVIKGFKSLLFMGR